MRKLIISLLLALLICQNVFAGSLNIGVDAGYVLGIYDQNGGHRENRKYSPGHAFEVSVPIEYRFNSWLSMTSGVRYIGKAYDVTQDDRGYDSVTGNTIDLRCVEHFFEVPLTMRFSLDLNPVRLYAGCGAYVGVRFLYTEMGLLDFSLVSSVMFYDKYWGIDELDPASDNLFDAGILAEVGFGYMFDNMELYLSARYQYSLTSLDRNYQRQQISRYIDTLSITAGLNFRIGGEK